MAEKFAPMPSATQSTAAPLRTNMLLIDTAHLIALVFAARSFLPETQKATCKNYLSKIPDNHCEFRAPYLDAFFLALLILGRLQLCAGNRDLFTAATTFHRGLFGTGTALPVVTYFPACM